MDNQNLNNGNENKSIFENNGEYVETSTKEPRAEEPTVVTPVVERRDLADKTIDAVEDFIDTKDHHKEFTNEEVNKYKTGAVISYIPLVSLYYILTNKYKESNYLKFHVNQGLNITIAYVISFFIDKILTAIFSSDSLVIDSTPALVSVIIYVLYFIFLLAMFFGIVNTVNGFSKEIPVIGKFKIIK